MIKKMIRRVPGARTISALAYRLRRRRQIRQQFFHLHDTTKEQRFELDWTNRNLWLFDNTQSTGFDRHYIYHPAWAARILAETKPAVHVDMASTLAFCSLISAFVPMRFYDYRPAQLALSNLECGHADLTALQFADNTIESLSCMHVVEHVGLGRYGDPIDYDGDLKAIAELKRVVAPGGTLLFVVPIGQPCIQFNAHRIYSYRQVINAFTDFELKQFALVPDDPKVGDLVIDASEALADKQSYGCGCFWFVKSSAI